MAINFRASILSMADRVWGINMIATIIKVGFAWLGLGVLTALVFGWIVNRGKEE